MWNKLIKLWILVTLVCTCGFVSHAPVFAKIKTSDWITTHVDSLTFKDDAYLKKHYYKHGRQMGYASPKAYLAGARRVISDPDVLTKREKEILLLIRQGFLSKEIAYKLNLSIYTVNNHRKNILAKLNVDNVIEALNRAESFGILY